MKSISRTAKSFLHSIRLQDFLILTFGLSFLTEGLFLFFQELFLHGNFPSFFYLLFFALVGLYGFFLSQIQTRNAFFQAFSLSGILISSLYWLILSPIAFFKFYQLFLAYRPLPARLLSFIFLYRWKVLPIIVVLYLLLLYLVWRLLLVPCYLNDGLSLKESLQKSWQQRQFTLGLQLISFLLIPLLFLLSGLVLKILFTLMAQLIATKTAGLSLLLLYQICKNSLFTLFFLYLAFNNQGEATLASGKNYWLIFPIIASLALFGLTYTQRLTIKPRPAPQTISHRGVSDSNALQNSITALKRTNQAYRPDLIEMDIQETADHQLVVMHDENLNELAGKNIRIDETNWSQLKKLTLKENGYQAKIPLFADYLAEANKLKQPLLIELKVSAKTKKTIIQQLLPLKDQLVGHQLQSMDLETAENLKKNFPKHKVGYILPFDLLGSPRTQLDFINIEARTANRQLIQASQQRKQAVYIWSINTSIQNQVFRLQPVDGLLSDKLTILTPQNSNIKAKVLAALWLN